MLVTVKEASEMECRSIPFETMLLSPESIPRYPPIDHPHCSANGCMKWRWWILTRQNGAALPLDERQGYCGLAGRP